MIGAEIQDETGMPLRSCATGSSNRPFQRGLLLLPCGASTIRFCPPLCLTARQVETGLAILAAAMAAVSTEGEPFDSRSSGTVAQVGP